MWRRLPAPPHTHGTVRMMICGREHRVSIFLLLFCIVCWVVVVGSVGLMHVAVMFVCWFGWLCHKSLAVLANRAQNYNNVSVNI